MPSIVVIVVVAATALVAAASWAVLARFARRSLLRARARSRFTLASGAYLLGWLCLALVLSAAGAFQASPSRVFPWITLGIALPTIAGAVLVFKSAALRTVVAATPVHWLVGIQLYRVVGGGFLYFQALGRLPAAFAVPAGVGDLAVGLAAPLVAYLYNQSYLSNTGRRWSWLAAVAWNVLGVLDLAVALAMGFLTSPGPLNLFSAGAPNELIAAFPLALVPLFAVPLSVLLHIAALKRLRVAAAALPRRRARDDRDSSWANASGERRLQKGQLEKAIQMLGFGSRAA